MNANKRGYIWIVSSIKFNKKIDVNSEKDMHERETIRRDLIINNKAALVVGGGKKWGDIVSVGSINLVSQKFKDLIIKNKVKNIQFHPIYIKSGNDSIAYYHLEPLIK